MASSSQGTTLVSDSPAHSVFMLVVMFCVRPEMEGSKPPECGFVPWSCIGSCQSRREIRDRRPKLIMESQCCFVQEWETTACFELNTVSLRGVLGAHMPIPDIGVVPRKSIQNAVVGTIAQITMVAP